MLALIDSFLSAFGEFSELKATKWYLGIGAAH